MDFEDSPEEAAFRAEARGWLAQHAPTFAPPTGAESDAEGYLQFPLAQRWQAVKADAGYARVAWPKDFGGRGGTISEQIIFEEEQRHYPLPTDPFKVSLGMCIPTLMAWADPATLDRHVPSAIRGDTLWCQMFSETSAGSDLANVRTRAVPADDGSGDWLITGHKVWTTAAHLSHWGTILVRTDPDADKYKGLSYFYVDMRSPGIDVRPIRQSTGHASFNEVFLEDVRVPDSQRLGPIGEGWKVAISTLMSERMSVSEGDLYNITVDDIVVLARSLDVGGRRAIDDPAFRSRLAEIYSRIAGLRYTRYRLLTRLSRGDMPGPEAALGKLVLAQSLQTLSALAMELHGARGIVMDSTADPRLAEIQEAWLFSAGTRIAGGTDEILRNTIAERVLGLPPEPRGDRGVPFNQLGG